MNSGIISQATYAQNSPIQKAVAEFLNGRKEPYSKEELESIVRNRYFGFTPLMPLAPEEETFLFERMVIELNNAINKGALMNFIQSNCFICAQPDNPNHVFSETYCDLEQHKLKLRPLSNEEKRDFLNNPSNIYSARWSEKNSTSGFSRMGYRRFVEYPGHQKFPSTVRDLQARQQRNNLRALDLGGGIGLALHDIKGSYPELVTINATRDEEASHYPVDFHVIAFMERMPAALADSVDFIFSNMATRYFAYTDLVIENCISMLVSGGIMDVFFSSERSCNSDRKDVQRRMKKAHDMLIDMERSGLIELKINNNYVSCLGTSHKSAKGTLFPAANVYVRKL